MKDLTNPAMSERPETHSGRDPDGRGRERVTHSVPYMGDGNSPHLPDCGERERAPRLEDGFASRMPINRRTCGY